MKKVKKLTKMNKLTVYTVEDFRKWLAKYHAIETKVQIVLHKRHTGKGAPTQRELMDEAICYGWIDTTVHRLDEDRYIRRFSRRSDSSKWSNNTIRYGQLLIEQGRMTEHGLKFYQEGLAKPTHDHGIPLDPPMPPELARALAKNKKAARRFDALAPSTKRSYYRMLLRAKRPETKEKLIRKILAGF